MRNRRPLVMLVAVVAVVIAAGGIAAAARGNSDEHGRAATTTSAPSATSSPTTTSPTTTSPEAAPPTASGTATPTTSGGPPTTSVAPGRDAKAPKDKAGNAATPATGNRLAALCHALGQGSPQGRAMKAAHGRAFQNLNCAGVAAPADGGDARDSNDGD